MENEKLRAILSLLYEKLSQYETELSLVPSELIFIQL